jgi:pantothenate kinase
VKYFSENNSVDYLKILKVPVSDRLPELSIKVGLGNMIKILMAEIVKFQNCYNVIRPMNPDQIAQCSFSIIQTAEEDFLSLEDVILFFEGAKQGKYGKVYDRLDQQIIFEMLEVYRDERHRVFIGYKDEQNAQYKATPVNDRIVFEMQQQEKDKTHGAMCDYFKDKMSKENRA